MNNTTFDSYVQEGCGRCHLFQSPACKVHQWTDLLIELRELLLEAGLEEQMKWGTPCYMFEGKNIIMLSSLKGACVLGFLKGAALADEDHLLVSPGPNTRFARQLRFTSLAELIPRRAQIARYIQAAIALERAGIKVEVDDALAPLPLELDAALAADMELASAFEALTPGRQRSYILHISGAKQPQTRERRVERCVDKILAGKGFHDQ